MQTITIVSPCYNESDNIPIFLDQIKRLRNRLSDRVEVDLVVVDDFSKDGSRQMLEKLELANSWLTVIYNPRNYGVYRASYNGLKIAEGDLIVPMLPVDMQDPIDVLESMIRVKLADDRVTAVFGRKVDREESFLTKNLRKIFYKILGLIGTNVVHQNVGEFGVVDRWVIDECIRRDDYYPYLRGMIANITQEIVFFDYVWKFRIHGKSKHNFSKLFDQGMNGIISSGGQFFRPLTILGFLISICSVMFGFVNVALYILNRALFEVQGIATIIVLLSLLFGFLFVFLGFLGEYVMAIHSQVRGIDRYMLQKKTDTLS
jgi:glycosyltransferase involved in cell wall biosynthesis